MASKQCANCGAKLPDTATICFSCQTPAPAKKRRAIGKAGWVAGSVVLLSFLAIIGPSACGHRESEQLAKDIDSQHDAFVEKYGDGEKGAGAENGNKWVYRTRDDAMRSQRHLFATETSTNAELLVAGIGGASRLVLGVRRLAGRGDDAYLTIPNGQFNCNLGNCRVSVKFDDKPVQDFDAAEPTNGSYDTLYIRRSSAFLDGLKASKKATIEARFFEEGPRQFTFRTSDLHWPPTDADLKVGAGQ